jgi:mRNA interferase RelE/StbE
MYKVVVLKSAEKELMKLPIKVQLKIIEAIDELAENPRPFGYKKLVGRDGYRIKIGNY